MIKCAGKTGARYQPKQPTVNGSPITPPTWICLRSSYTKLATSYVDGSLNRGKPSSSSEEVDPSISSSPQQGSIGHECSFPPRNLDRFTVTGILRMLVKAARMRMRGFNQREQISHARLSDDQTINAQTVRCPGSHLFKLSAAQTVRL